MLRCGPLSLQWMAAVDTIITKAGPGTIAEALISGLPILLNGNVPCQVGPWRMVACAGWGFAVGFVAGALDAGWCWTCQLLAGAFVLAPRSADKAS